MFRRTSSKDPATPRTIDEKMDVIITYLERMDRRDRLRMWGGVMRVLLTVVPLVFFLWSGWYLYEHGDEILGNVMRQSAQNAAQATGQGYEDILEQFRQMFGGETQQ